MKVTQVTEPEAARWTGSIPKQGRERDVKWLKWLMARKEWRCIFTGSSEPDPHHITTRGAGGSDYQVVPISHLLHAQLHQEGARFWTPVRLSQLWDWAIEAHYLKLWYGQEKRDGQRKEENG